MTETYTVTIQNEVADNQRITLNEDTINNEPNDDINNNVVSDPNNNTGEELDNYVPNTTANDNTHNTQVTHLSLTPPAPAPVSHCPCPAVYSSDSYYQVPPPEYQELSPSNLPFQPNLPR